MSEYVRKYASEEALRQAEATAVSSSSESSMSDFSEDEAQVTAAILKFLHITNSIFDATKGEKKNRYKDILQRPLVRKFVMLWPRMG